MTYFYHFKEDLIMNKKVLVINCGSSSLKYSLYEMPKEKLICAGIFESLDSDKVATYKYLGYKMGCFHDKGLKKKAK